MASGFGFCFHPALHRDDCSGFVHLWVHDTRGKICFIPTTYDIRHAEWDPITRRIAIPKHSSPLRKIQLRYYAECMRRDLAEMEALVNDLLERDACFADDIADMWQARVSGAGVGAGVGTVSAEKQPDPEVSTIS